MLMSAHSKGSAYQVEEEETRMQMEWLALQRAWIGWQLKRGKTEEKFAMR